MKNLPRILLIVAILILVNLLARRFFMRFDLTQDKQYTLSQATKNILNNLEEPVLVKGYFTGDLPQQYAKTKDDFQDMLIEYSNRSKGMVDYIFVNPNENPENEQEAVQNGISPLLINVREKDESVQKKAFMGAVIEVGEQKDVIPFVQPEGPMEYQLTTAIKKVSAVDKPSIGIIQGHGEPSLQDLGLPMQALSVLYQVEPIDLNTTSEIAPRFKTLLLVKPNDTIPPHQLAVIDSYLNQGGNLCLALDAVQGNFQTAQGSAFSVGIEPWLAQKGLTLEPEFVLDASAGSVSVQQRQGQFNFNTQVNFPYFPAVKSFSEHPVTKGLEQIVFQLVSPITYNQQDGDIFHPFLKTSDRSSVLSPPISFDIQKKWTTSDFPNKAQTIGGVLERGNGSKIVLFGDGDFVLGSQGRGQNPDNVNLIVNAVDYLSDDTGLIDLRTKGVATRPIDDIEEGKQSSIKWLNFLLPLLLVVLYGFFRFSRNRSRRIRRMETRYI